jgi:hypothetical protein
MSKLWAEQVIKGIKSFNDVPRLLKEQVKKILIKQGYEYLVSE